MPQAPPASQSKLLPLNTPLLKQQTTQERQPRTRDSKRIPLRQRLIIRPPDPRQLRAGVTSLVRAAPGPTMTAGSNPVVYRAISLISALVKIFCGFAPGRLLKKIAIVADGHIFLRKEGLHRDERDQFA